MRSIRAKLFLSIGIVLLLFAFFSYLVPRFFVHKDIDEASIYLNDVFVQYQKKLQNLSGAWITYRFVQEAAQLTAVSERIKIGSGSVWKMAASVIEQDPDLAIVQVTDNQNQTAVISQESGQFYIPLWAKDETGNLWIQIPEKNAIYLAVQKNKNIYLLFSNDQKDEAAIRLNYQQLHNRNFSTAHEKPNREIYDTLRKQESSLLEKSKMIQELAISEKKAEGILYIDFSSQTGSALLAEEIFFSQKLVDAKHPIFEPFVIYREYEQSYVNLMEFVTDTAPFIIVGYSLSSIAADISKIIHKPVLLYHQGALLQGFTDLGEPLLLNDLSLSSEKITWQKKVYIPSSIDIGPLSFSILIPATEKKIIQTTLAHVRESLISKLSYNLLILAFFLFLISIISLARISKKITKPISQLALASEDISRGKFEDLDLPPIEKRHDEVAILSHSFQKMVVSLRDREKIRGVLNKVVSKEIAATILNSNVELEGEMRNLTLLFSDIRGFTPLSESLSPPKLIKLLNAYMTRMCRIIDETHGVVDKFVGDEIMALYGAPLRLENHVDKAITAAIWMMKDLKHWNQERINEPQISIGIGIHTGPAFAGNMGAEDRQNYTVVGANVNLAARLCSAALQMQILISEDTYKNLAYPEKFKFNRLTPIALKGIDEPVPIYEVVTDFSILSE